MARPVPDPVGEGQESVWRYPRPAIAEATGAHLRVELSGRTIAETRRALRTLETSHPPSYYFPPDEVAAGVLRPSGRTSFCEWKGRAVYFDVVVGREVRRAAAWAYPQPSPPFAALAGHLAFYAAAMDAAFVDGERVVPQPGGFYGGWITSRLAGPFKGVPGSQGW